MRTFTITILERHLTLVYRTVSQPPNLVKDFQVRHPRCVEYKLKYNIKYI